MSKPTDGAMRAANAVSHAIPHPKNWSLSGQDDLAEIIDRETGLPDLIAALLVISQAGACGDHTLDIQVLEACITIACQALAKVGGKGGRVPAVGS